MSKRAISTQFAPKAIGPYSQAILDDPYLFISGQLPINPATGKIEATDVAGQTKQVLANLEAILKEAGLDFTDVVRSDVFMINLQEFQTMNGHYQEKFSHASPPARQTIQVARLPMDALVEISCIARKK